MLDAWNSVVGKAVALRRDLHRRPELTWAEFETAKTVRKELDKAGVPWRACTETGTVATLAPEAKGRHIALRADIDALPIVELTGAPWASEAEGCMHACGHDGHTATLMAAAWHFKKREAELPGPVTLLFQPAEEGGHGAKRMIEDGALRGVDAIFGWHNWPQIPFGKAVCPDGAVMAANATFEITLRGKGGHASQPDLCSDPTLAAAAITVALQQIVSRRLPPQQAAVVSVTSIDARSMETVIPEQARLGGSIRVADMALLGTINELIASIARDTAQAYGVTASVELFPRYPPTLNHPMEASQYREALSVELGADWHHGDTPIPVMASEDFSYYLRAVPGAFALIGADDGGKHSAACHNPYYDFNDALIPVVLRVFSRIAGLEPPVAGDG